MDFEEYQANARDKLLDATYGLWNALLTVNGIILTVFSALYAVTPLGKSPLVLFIVGACVISACLLIFNHLSMKRTYHRIFELMSSPKTSPTKEERERDIRDSLRRQKAVSFSEKTALVLFVMEVLCIAVFVWNSPAK